MKKLFIINIFLLNYRQFTLLVRIQPGSPGDRLYIISTLNFYNTSLNYTLILPGNPLGPGKPYEKKKKDTTNIVKVRKQLFTRSPGAPGNPKI